MEDNSRRSFLRKSGIVAGSVALSGVGAATSSPAGKTSLQLRRGLSDPIAPAEIERQRRKITENSIEEGSYIKTQSSDGRDLVADRSRLDLDDNEHIVAYNIDIVDGGPAEWIGTITTSKETSGRRSRQSGGRRGSGVQAQSTSSHIEEIHKKADRDAEKKKHASSSVTTQGSPQDFSEWPSVAKTENYNRVTECCGYADGHETGWTYQWRSPNNESEGGIKGELRMHPQRDNPWWEEDIYNDWAQLTFDYNSSTANVKGYGPGNTRSKTASGWDIQVSSDDSMSVGYSSTNYKSDVQINNYSNIDSDERVKHRYDISGRLRSNTVVVNSAAGSNNDPSRNEKFVTIDGQTKYDIHQSISQKKIGKEVTYGWH